MQTILSKQTYSLPMSPSIDAETDNLLATYIKRLPSQPTQVERTTDSEMDGNEVEEDNLSEMTQTLLQSTQRSHRHPVANFNESHPTQQIQGMTQMKQ